MITQTKENLRKVSFYRAHCNAVNLISRSFSPQWMDWSSQRYSRIVNKLRRHFMRLQEQQLESPHDLEASNR